MSDHTPTIPDLREAWQEAQLHGPSEASAAEFDRAIAKVRADAKAEALREAVSALNEVVEDAASYGITNGLAWQTGALAMRDQLKIRADKLVTDA